MLTPYLTYADARAAIAFYESSFGATLNGEPWIDDQDRVGYAHLLIGDGHLFLSDEYPEIDVLGPASRGGATGSIVLSTPDADAVFDRAVGKGATVANPMTDQPHGRTGKLVDPFGHVWHVHRSR
jgi:PhnB protein